MIVHLCCFWPVKTTGCQLQKTTCDVAGCDVMKRECRYISFWNWFCIWSYTNCRLLVVKTLLIWDSYSNWIQTWTNQNFKEWDRVVLFFWMVSLYRRTHLSRYGWLCHLFTFDLTCQVICRKKVWRCSPGSSFYWLCYLPHWWITLPRWDAMPPNEVIDPALLCRWL